MAKKETTTNNVNEFQGWDNPDDIDFFGEKADSDSSDPDGLHELFGNKDEAGKPKPEDITDEEEQDTPPANEQEEEEEDYEFNFGRDDQDEEEQDDPENPKPPKQEEATSNLQLFNQLRERGLIEYEDEEGAEELTEERAAELIEDSYEDTLENRIGDKMQNLPPVTKQLLQFALKGGNEREFLERLSSQPSVGKISETMDLDDEKNAEIVMREKLRRAGNDDEFIDSNIEFMKDKGSLVNFGKKAHSEMIAADKAERDAQIQKAAQAEQARKAERRKFKNTITDTLTKEKDINGLPITTKSKRELPDYMTKESVKLQDGRSITQYQYDMHKAMQNPKFNMIMAELVRSDFNFEPLIKAGKTSQTKKVQDNVRRTDNSGSSQPKQRTTKSLADFFN